MPNLKANGIQIEYDTFGASSCPALLLIMGFSGQMILWEADFCRQLADRGFHVIRFDNRDVGLSSRITSGESAGPETVIQASLSGKEMHPPYTLEDMARDGMGLLSGLGIQKAHICGTSMGGMIAQIMAIQFPDRVLSLISMSSTTGSPDLLYPEPATVDTPQVLPVPAPREREANIEYTVEGLRDLSGPGFPFDEAYARKVAAASYDRAFYPEGAGRQLLAILAAENRRPFLKRLSIPTLVIHGDADPLVLLSGGLDTVNAVPGADLLVIEGMGHDMPRQAWPRIIDAIASHCGTFKT